MLWRWAAAASLCIPNPLPPVWSVEQSPWHPQFTYCSCGRSPLPSAWWELNHNSWEAAAVQGSGKDRGAPKEPSCARSRCVWEVGSRLRPSFHCWLACGISCLARQLCTCHLRKRKNWEWRRKQTLKNPSFKHMLVQKYVRQKRGKRIITQDQLSSQIKAF